MNREDPRVRRTRKLIEQAFFELLTEKSFHQISVQDIAERATVNRATFYAHFEDKYQLFDQLVREWFQKALCSKLPPAAGFSGANLRSLILATVEALAAQQDHCVPSDRDLEPIFAAAAQQELRQFLLAWLRDEASAGSPGTTATVMSWAIFGAALEWSREKPRRPAEPVANEILAAVSRGLPVPSDAEGAPHRERVTV